MSNNTANIIAHLNAGTTITEDEARAVMRLAVESDYGGSLTAAAKAWRVSKAYLCDYRRAL